MMKFLKINFDGAGVVNFPRKRTPFFSFANFACLDFPKGHDKLGNDLIGAKANCYPNFYALKSFAQFARHIYNFQKMNLPDFASFYWIALLSVGFFVIITGRYFIVAGLFYGIFYKWFPVKFSSRKINKKGYNKGQLKKEIKWSVISSLLFSVVAAFTVVLWQKGYTKIYDKLDLYGLWYIPVSLLIYIFLQETYYYWIHRWMHLPAIFRVVHKVHHDSRVASPFTAFSFIRSKDYCRQFFCRFYFY